MLQRNSKEAERCRNMRAFSLDVAENELSEIELLTFTAISTSQRRMKLVGNLRNDLDRLREWLKFLAAAAWGQNNSFQFERNRHVAQGRRPPGKETI